jgi:hypothetical protein
VQLITMREVREVVSWTFLSVLTAACTAGINSHRYVMIKGGGGQVAQYNAAQLITMREVGGAGAS